MWSSMPAPWQACFEEAWEAYCSGSIPIGAAIADRHGTVISRGRNRMHEAEAPPDQICGTRLAHAEINALLQIRTADSGELKDLIIYTTTEPCVLCFGAIAMSGIRTVRYAECDLNRSGNAFIRDRISTSGRRNIGSARFSAFRERITCCGRWMPPGPNGFWTGKAGITRRRWNWAGDGTRRAGWRKRRAGACRSRRWWMKSRRNSIGCSGRFLPAKGRGAWTSFGS